ncbi:homeobox-leucine zipper protein athb-15 [Quercus suber]|uniref:Homeobox-leucine zipper protein athb-15 n=1 Tax=Quercus suber TaxID=58331 RepID=A0AAW0L307_QUESU
MMAVSSSCNKLQMDNGKYVRYTPEQVEALERLYHDCPKPSSMRRQQLIRECPILSNIEPKQIKVWFQNRRCREKQRKEASRLQAVNRKLTAMNKLLMEENDRLQKQATLATTDTSCESVVTSGQHHLTPQHPPKDASPAGLISIAEETLTEFLSKATGTAVEWVQMPGMKALRHLRQISQEHSQPNVSGWGRRPAALRALSQRLSKGFNEAVNGFTDEGWSMLESDGIDDVTILVNSSPAKMMGGNLSYANGFQSMSNAVLCAKASMLLQNVPPAILLRFLREHRSEWADSSIDAYSAAAIKAGPCSLPGVRAGSFGGQVILPLAHTIEHEEASDSPGPDSIGIVAISHGCTGVAARACGLVGLEPTRVAEILKDRPTWFHGCRAVDVISVLSTANGGTIELLYMQLYAPTTLAPARDFWLLRYTSVLEDGSLVVCERSLNNTQNGPSMPQVQHFVRAEMLPSGYLIRPCEGGGSIIHIVDHMDLEPWSVPEVLRPLYESSTLLAQKTTMAVRLFCIRHLRQISQEHSQPNVSGWGRRPAALRALSQRLSKGFNEAVNGFTDEGWSMLESDGIDDVTILFMEVIKLESMGHYREDMMMAGDIFLLQLCSGVDENAVGNCAELIFAPIDASFSDDAPIIPSGFRIIPLDSGIDSSSPNRTLDLASALEVGPTGNRASGENSGQCGSTKSVMTIAFQFAFEIHLQDNVAAMARQYIRSIIASVQRVALVLSPSHFGSHAGIRPPPGTPEAHTLARWICQSYRCYLGVELLKSEGSESILKTLWHHSDAVMCCSLKALPVFTFANQAGLDMLETTLVALQDITLEKIFDDNGKKTLCSEFPQIMQQGFMCLQGGICLSSMGRPISYERAVAWKVLNEEENAHCICFMFINWSFV